MLPTFSNTITPLGLVNFALNVLELVSLFVIARAWRDESRQNNVLRKGIAQLIDIKKSKQ